MVKQLKFEVMPKIKAFFSVAAGVFIFLIFLGLDYASKFLSIYDPVMGYVYFFSLYAAFAGSSYVLANYTRGHYRLMFHSTFIASVLFIVIMSVLDLAFRLVYGV